MLLGGATKIKRHDVKILTLTHVKRAKMLCIFFTFYQDNIYFLPRFQTGIHFLELNLDPNVRLLFLVRRWKITTYPRKI